MLWCCMCVFVFEWMVIGVECEEKWFVIMVINRFVVGVNCDCSGNLRVWE